MQAFKFSLEVGADGGVILPRLPLKPGTPLEVIVLVPEAEEGFRRLAAKTMDFWDNSVDDEIWNNA